LIESFLSLEGTSTGHWLAVFLALAAAVLHATFEHYKKGSMILGCHAVLWI